MTDTALGSIQDSLNMAFSELEVSLLDEQSSAEQNSLPVVKSPVMLAEKAGPPTLDLEFIESVATGDKVMSY